MQFLCHQIVPEAFETSLALPKRGLPVTIITGFLGSGKTTLLNQILQNRQDLKVAVLVNEFGDIDIDGQLLLSIEEDMVQLSNGCICCTINDSLVETVYQVLERSDRVDYLVIETTGVADPLPIILTFLGSALRDLARLDGVVTLVDAETFSEAHFDSEAALHQVLYGDIMLLNKTDLVTAAQHSHIEACLRQIKPDARIYPTRYGQIPLPLILDVSAHSPALVENCRHLHPDDHHHDHADHDHNHASHHLDNDGFMSMSFTADRLFELEKFQAFLDQLPPNVFRAKGLLHFIESNLTYVFQLSGKRCHLDTDRRLLPPDTPLVQLVLIGRDLPREEIRAQLHECFAPAPAIASVGAVLSVSDS